MGSALANGFVLFADFKLVVDKRPQVILGMIFFGIVALFATKCLFSSNAALSSARVAKFVGTSNPWVARGVCALGAVVGWLAVGMFAAAIFGDHRKLVTEF